MLFVFKTTMRNGSSSNNRRHAESRYRFQCSVQNLTIYLLTKSGKKVFCSFSTKFVSCWDFMLNQYYLILQLLQPLFHTKLMKTLISSNVFVIATKVVIYIYISNIYLSVSFSSFFKNKIVKYKNFAKKTFFLSFVFFLI